MKVIPFTIPVPSNTSVYTEHELLPHFYEHLHRHKEIQLTYIIRGKGSLLSGSQLHPFHPDCLFMIGANTPHVFKSDQAYFQRKKKDAVEAWSIFFDPTGALSHLLHLPEMQHALKWLGRFESGIIASPNLAATCRPLVQRVMQGSGAERLAAFILLLQKLSAGRIAQSFTPEVRKLSESEGQRMNTVMRYSIENFREQINITQAAGQVHMTPQAFCRYFKKHTRKTYIEFLHEIRIHEACKLLLENGMGNLSNLSWQCGFTNVPNFNRVFRKVMGCTPGEFVKRSAG